MIHPIAFQVQQGMTEQARWESRAIGAQWIGEKMMRTRTDGSARQIAVGPDAPLGSHIGLKALDSPRFIANLRKGEGGAFTQGRWLAECFFGKFGRFWVGVAMAFFRGQGAGSWG